MAGRGGPGAGGVGVEQGRAGQRSIGEVLGKRPAAGEEGRAGSNGRAGPGGLGTELRRQAPPAQQQQQQVGSRAGAAGGQVGGSSGRGGTAQPQQQQKPLPSGYVGAYGGVAPVYGKGQAVPEQQHPPAKRQAVGGSTATGAGAQGGGRAGSGAGGGSGSGAASTFQPVASGVLSGAAATVPCSLCGTKPMKNAHEGPCGHVACYGCWAVQLATQFKCKTCGRPMRQKNLTKKYFM